MKNDNRPSGAGKTTAALFDLDGVVVDTEPQYSKFWREQAAKYLPDIPDFDMRIKGRTLKEIFRRHFGGRAEVQEHIRAALADFEANMTFEYIPGVADYVKDLRAHGVRTAIVTSSDNHKIAALKRSKPEIDGLFEDFITAERITRSKPDPEGYLLGAEVLGVEPENSFVMEDAFTGMEAGRAAGMRVVGLSTTFPAEELADKADAVIPDFRGFSYDRLMQIRYTR